MKRKLKVMMTLMGIFIIGAPIQSTAESVVINQEQLIAPDNLSNRSFAKEQESQEPFVAKTESERQQLPKEEQEMVDTIEKYLTDNANLNSRNFGPAINKLIASLVFDVTVRRDNTIIDAAKLFGLIGGSEKSAWFDQVSGKSERYLTVYDEPTGTNTKLHAYYVDNQSDKTAVVQHGYRSNAMNLMREAELLYNLGYNVIIPDARSHGQSEGAYISFGAYERNDINAWIDQELETKPNQKIVLLGVSMGAATVMMSQETPHPNVQAVIEDCGYYSMEQQARDVARIVTSKLQYIPIVNTIDWYNCETQIIDSLNDHYVKPILKIDLYDISPLNAVSKSNTPKLFIHGTADWFIPPVAKDKLYTASLGYKEQLDVLGSGHAENITVGGDVYKNKVVSFLNTVSQMNSLRPELAETKNLLLNTEFKRNQTETSFDSWKLSNNGIDFSNRWESNPYEFVMKRSRNDILSAISVDSNGVKFYKKWEKSAGYVGQEVALTKGQTYELSFDSWNPNPTEYSEQVINYGFGQTAKREKQTAKKKVTKKMAYTPTKDGVENIYFGSEMTMYNLLGRTNTAMYFSNIKLIDTDMTTPEKIKISSVESSTDGTSINGQGEIGSKVIAMTPSRESVVEALTDASGNFVLSIPKQEPGSILHLVNQDVKGNTSESIVLAFN